MSKTETKIDQLRRLFTKYGLVEEDVFKQSRGGKQIVIITRTGIDKIQASANIAIRYEIAWIDLNTSTVGIKAIGSMDGRVIETFGSATPKNCTNLHHLEMAEKRARARAVLMLAGFYEEGVFGEGENLDDGGGND